MHERVTGTLRGGIKAENICFAKGCDTPIAPEYLMCHKHWFAVPENLRDEVWRSHRAKDRSGWAKAAVAARKAVAHV